MASCCRACCCADERLHPTASAQDYYDELAAHIRAQGPTGHSLLRHLADDLPQSALERLRQPPALSKNSLLRPGNAGE